MSKSICNNHGIYSESRCPKCKTSNNKDYDNNKRDKDLVKFYNSQRWRETSKKFLKHNPLCCECSYPAEITDHIEEIRDGGSRYDWENLQPMCRRCHNIKTAKERSKRGGGIKSLESKRQNTEAPSKFSQNPCDGGTP